MEMFIILLNQLKCLPLVYINAKSLNVFEKSFDARKNFDIYEQY